MTLSMLFVMLAATVSTLLLRSARRRGASGASLILLAVPLAVLPPLTAVTTGAWQLRYTLSQIAATGAGGVGGVAIVARDAVQAVVVGVAVSVVFIIAVTTIALWSSRRTDAPATPATGGRTVALLAGLAIAALGLTGGLVLAAERAAVGLMARFGTLIPVSPPASYVEFTRQSTADWVVELGRLSTATTIGASIAIALIAGLVWLEVRRSGGTVRIVAHPALVAVVGVLSIGAAAIYLVRSQAALAWLGEFVARTGI